ncbi:MAG: hypothetical protein JXB40_06260, partial [Candidatus Omnitrophica bacterium]|nr:hypothetical protein [Candidatus Omnitrophota bacterium]
GTFTVMNDVDASDTVNWNGRLGFDPIRGFYGKLDGQGNTVSGLTIERPDEDYVGLFGDTNRAPDNWTVPVIQNLNLASAAVSGRDYVGTLVGAGYGTDIRNINLSDVDVNGRNSVGGLIGLSSDKANYYLNGFGRWIEHAQTPGLVSYSSVSGNVMGTGEFIGGLVGRTANAGSTSLMLNSISYSSSSATVTGNNAVGGLLGNLNSVNLYGQGVSNCYADGYVYGNSNFGGLVGQNIQSGITGITDSYTPNIYNALDLQLMKYDLDGTFTVMNDVDASDTVNWNGEKGFEPINNFKGTFNGGGHTIDGIAINRPNDWCVGLFGYIDGATISDVGISGGSIKGSQYVGALVGYSNATGLRSSSISRSFSTASVEGIYSVGGLVGYAYRTSISDSYVNAAVRGTQDVGGLVGYNDYYSTISNSYSAGSSYGINSNNNNIGGLVGLNNHAAISNSYSVALVSGSGNYGRLVGENAYGTIRNSAELDLHNGINAIGYDDATNGPRRYLYPDMGLDVISPWIFYSPRYLPTIYTSWNFDSIWSEENGLPQLKWQTA